MTSVQNVSRCWALAAGLRLPSGASRARAQFFRPIERIPEPTVQDADPGRDRVSAEAVPYEFRLVSDDISDLYDRVKVGAKVTVRH